MRQTALESGLCVQPWLDGMRDAGLRLRRPAAARSGDDAGDDAAVHGDVRNSCPPPEEREGVSYYI